MSRGELWGLLTICQRLLSTSESGFSLVWREVTGRENLECFIYKELAVVVGDGFCGGASLAMTVTSLTYECENRHPCRARTDLPARR
jgi:hypothetical protein